MATQNTTDYDIQALVDNQLSWEEEKLVRAFIERDFQAQKRYEELLKQKTLIKKWWLKSKSGSSS